MAGDYFILETPLGRAMDMWPLHIDRYDQKYDNKFAENEFSVEDIMYWIHN